MKCCNQSPNQTVWEHGISVRDYLFDLIHYLKGSSVSFNWKIPNWLKENEEFILSNLLSEPILEQYTVFHDAGKPYCRTVDEVGKQHFPNHAEISYNKWLEIGGNEEVASLIKDDMVIHIMKATDVDDFIKKPGAISLLLTGLSEVHSNANMFGGIESTSFKIKWSQIDKRGKAIIRKAQYSYKNNTRI